MHERANGANIINVEITSSASDTGEEAKALASVPFCSDEHDAESFICSRSPRVEKFLKSDCKSLIKLNYARVFVIPEPDNSAQIQGFYCLSASHIERDFLNNRYRNSLPQMPAPMVLLGFMGRHDATAKGFGGILLADAALRVSTITELGIWGIMLHAENDKLVTWYDSQGFKLCPKNRVDAHNERLMYASLQALLPPR
jgi:hypothetical protein